jgi:hypothetical protein
MRREMARGALLPGFTEPPICFPPSYRRVKGAAPALVRARGDMAEPQRVREAYATVVKKRVGGAEIVNSPSGAGTPSSAGSGDIS